MTRIAVVGGGISGLTTAYAMETLADQAGLDISVVVIEKENRVGGKIWSRKQDGYLCEWGPNGFLDNKPMTLELCQKLGIQDRLVPSDDNARKRLIYAAGTLHRLPESGLAFLQSSLISWSGKFRLAAEFFVPPAQGCDDETLADFARRRLGPEALETLISPMVSGIFAGDPETMSLKSCFPRIYELEREYGGLLRAMRRLAKQKRREQRAGKIVASAAGPGGTLTSFGNGIQELTDAIAQARRGETLTGKTIECVEHHNGRYILQFADGDTIEADRVVVAAPAYAAARMLEALSPEATALLHSISYAPMNVVCLGYDRQAIDRNLDGFGYLIPAKEGRHTLGTLWDSSIFPTRAPEGKVLLRTMMGGAMHPSVADLDDATILRNVQDDLRQTMGIVAEPTFATIFRHEQAIPQYLRGHEARLAKLNDVIQRFPGLTLTGNAFYGIGINDCVKSSYAVAETLIGELAG